MALMRISQYHKEREDDIEWLNYIFKYDIVYQSKIFDFTKEDLTIIQANQIIKGGTGYDVSSHLPDIIDKSQCDYDIYPGINYSLQFFSRGCNRDCPFCIVRQKEGYIHPVDPVNLNPRGEWIEVLDNSFFANSNWRDAVRQLIKWDQPVNMHGVDIRTLTEEHAYALNKLKHHKQIHIAWDNPNQDLTPKLREVLQWISHWKLMCYVLIGFNSTLDQDIERIEKLRELRIDPFVMPYNKKDPYQKNLARYVNKKQIFKTISWNEYRKKAI